MDRNIGAGVVTPAGGSTRSAGAQDYLERLYKIIPAEVTAAYLAVSTLLTDPINPSANAMTLLLFGVFLTLLTPFYLWTLGGVRNRMQILVSTISFPIWAICISAALVALAFPYVTPQNITVVMVGWVLLAPLLVRP
jgi:hypothetical protein